MYFYLPCPIAYSVFPLLSANNSDGCGSLPGMGVGVIYTFIPGGSRPSVVWHELACHSFSLILITNYSKTKGHPKGSPIFQTYSF